MIWMIARKEFLEHVLSFRFSAAFALAVVLSAASAYVLNVDYTRQWEDYYGRVHMQDEWLDKYAHYNRWRGVFHPIKPPAKLSVLFRGIPEDVAVESFDNNPAPILFPLMDLLSIVAIIMSLLAMLFAYDATCGEKERGTLKLSVAGPLPRDKILVGK